MKHIRFNEAIDFFKQDYLSNLISLKHAHQLKDNAEYLRLEHSVAIRFNPKLMHHDRQLYGAYNSINILSNTHDLAEFGESLTEDGHVVKINGTIESAKFHLLRSFISLTSNTIVPFSCNNTIVRVEASDLPLYKDLFALVGYELKDVMNMIKQSSAYVIAIHKDDLPVSACVIYNVYKNIWEIAALATSEHYRRQSLGQELVLYALGEMRGSDRIPRYHVNVENRASLKLAEKCSLKPFLHFNHYAYQS